MTGLVKAVIEMSSKIQPAPPEEYVPMVKVRFDRCLLLKVYLFIYTILKIFSSRFLVLEIMVMCLGRGISFKDAAGYCG